MLRDSILLPPLIQSEVDVTQNAFSSLACTIALTEDEYSWLLQEYRRAIRDVWCGILGNPANSRPNLFQLDAKLLVYGRAQDGHIRAAVRVHVSSHSKPYLRKLRAVVRNPRGSQPRIRLRLVT